MVPMHCRDRAQGLSDVEVRELLVHECCCALEGVEDEEVLLRLALAAVGKMSAEFLVVGIPLLYQPEDAVSSGSITGRHYIMRGGRPMSLPVLVQLQGWGCVTRRGAVRAQLATRKVCERTYEAPKVPGDEFSVRR
jgi:hypothetical protein